MNFGTLLGALKTIKEEQKPEEEQKPTIGKAVVLDLNIKKSQEEINRAKKMNELTHKQRTKMNKKIERSAGYHDRLEKKDKLQKESLKNQNKNKKNGRKNEQKKE